MIFDFEYLNKSGKIDIQNSNLWKICKVGAKKSIPNFFKEKSFPLEYQITLVLLRPGLL